MICNSCNKDKPVSQMFSRKNRDKVQVLNICNDCHKLASANGGMKHGNQTQGYVLAVNSYTPQNEMVYIAWTANPVKLFQQIRDNQLIDVYTYGRWLTDKSVYREILKVAEPFNYRGKWYYFSPEIKKILNEW